MKNSYKILLSIGLIIGTINLLTYAFPIEAQKIVNGLENLNIYNSISGLVFLLTFIGISVMLWKNSSMEKPEKIKWIVLIILLPLIFGLIYLWSRDKQSTVYE